MTSCGCGRHYATTQNQVPNARRRRAAFERAGRLRSDQPCRAFTACMQGATGAVKAVTSGRRSTHVFGVQFGTDTKVGIRYRRAPLAKVPSYIVLATLCALALFGGT